MMHPRRRRPQLLLPAAALHLLLLASRAGAAFEYDFDGGLDGEALDRPLLYETGAAVATVHQGVEVLHSLGAAEEDKIKRKREHKKYDPSRKGKSEKDTSSKAAKPTPNPTDRPTKQPTLTPCGGPCDDGKLCTIDYCDEATNTCRAKPVECEANQTCDPFTGLCEDVQQVVPCVAVIDEWDNNNYALEWEEFRSQYPKRPFCLLVPEDRFWSPFPTGFFNDTVNNPDEIDRTIVSLVNRDEGDESLASDWFELCELDRYGPESIDFIGLFIDTSNSMIFDTVRSSAKQMVDTMNCKGIAFDLVFNGEERFITPFFTSLKPPEGVQECGEYDELCSNGGKCIDGSCSLCDLEVGLNCTEDLECSRQACRNGICVLVEEEGEIYGVDVTADEGNLD